MGFCCCSKAVNISIHSLGKRLINSENQLLCNSSDVGRGGKGGGFCHINTLGTLLNFFLEGMKLRSCSAYRRAKEEQGGGRKERLFLCRASLSYPTKNPASVIQFFLQTSGAGTDCRHDCPRESHLQAQLEMRARESIMNFLCSHRQELSLISFSGCSAPLSYINHWPG